VHWRSGSVRRKAANAMQRTLGHVGRFMIISGYLLGTCPGRFLPTVPNSAQQSNRLVSVRFQRGATVVNSPDFVLVMRQSQGTSGWRWLTTRRWPTRRWPTPHAHPSRGGNLRRALATPHLPTEPPTQNVTTHLPRTATDHHGRPTEPGPQQFCGPPSTARPCQVGSRRGGTRGESF
jgi:hypothetical protein